MCILQYELSVKWNEDELFLGFNELRIVLLCCENYHDRTIYEKPSNENIYNA